MKALPLAALAAAVLVSPMTTGAAQAAPDPTGTLCGFAATAHPQVDGSHTGVVVGGPLAFPDDTALTLAYTARLVCTIQTGTNGTHGGTDEAVVTGTASRVSTVADTVTYEAGEDEDVYLCSPVEFGGTRPVLYWDDGARSWSPNASVPCSLAISGEAPDPRPVSGREDSIYCPIWAIVFPEGDVVLPVLGTVWGCPPYDDDPDMRDLVYGREFGAFVHPAATEPR